jgi:hypothetical protein
LRFWVPKHVALAYYVTGLLVNVRQITQTFSGHEMEVRKPITAAESCSARFSWRFRRSLSQVAHTPITSFEKAFLTWLSFETDFAENRDVGQETRNFFPNGFSELQNFGIPSHVTLAFPTYMFGYVVDLYIIFPQKVRFLEISK